MPYSDQSMYPKGIKHTDTLSLTPIDFAPATAGEIKVASVVFAPSATARLDIRNLAGTTIYASCQATSTTNGVITGFTIPAGGFEVVASAVGSHSVTLFYHTNVSTVENL